MMFSRPANASGARGVPWRVRYSGDAQVTTRTAASRRATSEESESVAIRTAASKPSSTRLTARSEKRDFETDVRIGCGKIEQGGAKLDGAERDRRRNLQEAARTGGVADRSVEGVKFIDELPARSR